MLPLHLVTLEILKYFGLNNFFLKNDFTPRSVILLAVEENHL